MMKDVLAMVGDEVGLDVVACHVIHSFCAADGGGGGGGGEDEDTKLKIEVAVMEIMKFGDMSSLTIKDVLALVGDKICLDLSVLPQGTVAGQVIRPSTSGGSGGAVNGKDGGVVVASSVKGAAEEEEETKPLVTSVASRVICKLSNKRDVAIGGSRQKPVVTIREFFWKDGKQISSLKSISLSNEQWSIFRKSIPAIEEAIKKVESRLRSEIDRHDRSKSEIKQNGGTPSGSEPLTKGNPHHTPVKLVPIETIRFDGKNYQPWADRMETYLNQLQVAHVLSDPCPSAVGVSDKELGRTLSAVQKWTDDDQICRHNILNSLCDNLFGHYTRKPGTAKDLWDELKLIYLNEEHGSKVSLVKKYMEFQMVEEKPVFEQVQEFHHIADSINASGMYVEEKFHVNVILSKLPPSWKPYGVQLMKEDYLPVWMLMNHLKAEEESRRPILPRPDGPLFQGGRKLGPQRFPMKKLGIQPTNHETDRERKVKFCTLCKKKGHVLEQCWFRKPGVKDTTYDQNDNIGPAEVVAGVNMGGAAE